MMQNRFSHTPKLAAISVEGSSALATFALGSAALLAILIALNATALSMARTWYESNTFNHGFLIPFIAAYLAWRKRAALTSAMIAPDWRGVVGVAFASLFWLVGDAAGTLLIQEIGLVMIIQMLVLAIFGRAVFRILLFPLAYLFFAVPFGLELIPPLQTVTAWLSVGLLKTVGVPVFSDGYLISIPSGDWYVADACSGVRYVISSLALGGLFGGLMYVTWWRRVLVMIVAVVVPILANGVRAFGIILLAYLTDNKLATGVDHIIYGWVFFTLVSALVLAVGLSFRETDPNATTPRIVASPATASLLPSLLAMLLALAPVGAARAYASYIDSTVGNMTAHLEAPDIPGYQRLPADAGDPLLPSFEGADVSINANYENAEKSLILRFGYYLSERRGAQAVSLNHELPGAPETAIIDKGSVAAKIGDVATSVRYQRIFVANRGRVIWYWFWVDDRVTGNPYFAKLLEVKAKLLGGRQPAAALALAANYRSDPEEAETLLRDFALKSTPLLSALARAQLP